MELLDASLALSALAQPSRLEVFRLLVSADTELRAGDIAERLELPKPTLSFHLKELSHAGLVTSRREGRSLFYRICPDVIRGLIGFLTEDCCQGRPELCLPAGETACCVSLNQERA